MRTVSFLKRICKFAQPAQPPRIELSDNEQAIFGFLLDVLKNSGLQTELRVAGGWVRDKLMGKESDDIDIALEGMTGEDFKNHIDAYAIAYQQQTGGPHPALGKSYSVKANPEKSKHLETVAVQLYGQKIDFVNLRSETYAEGSRIPEQMMGTPEEDAFRRDLTINSLFYNINTGQVEDLTGMGLSDIQSMTLRTPLNPKQTFMDDPLRMLRTLRFMSRYENSKIDPQISSAMADPEVQKAYRDKVASERAGPELVKLLKGKKPAEALRILFDSGLDQAVFDVPEVSGYQRLKGFDQRSPYHALDLLNHTLLVIKNMNEIAEREGLDDETRMRMNMAALFHDYGKAHPEIATPSEKDPSKMQYIGHEDRSAEASDAIMNHLAIVRHDRQFVNKVVQMHMKAHHPGAQKWTKKMIGKFLKGTEIPGQEEPDLWRYILLHGWADAISKGTEDELERKDVEQQARSDIKMFEDYLSQPPPMQPLVGGKKIMEIFPAYDPASGYINFVKERLMEKQHGGEIATTDEALAFVRTLGPEIDAYLKTKETMAWVSMNLVKI